MSGTAGDLGNTFLEYDYSLGAKCATEAIAMGFTMYLGLSIIANELLPRTKGAHMGWGFVALGFGFAFGVNIVMFNFISAHINPAMCLALWVAGKIPAGEFFALSACEFGGAFVGAVLVWLHYLPHFKNVPEPPADTPDDLLLRSRDALSPSALNIASYDTRAEPQEKELKKALNVGRVLRDVQYYFRTDQVPKPEKHLYGMALGPDEMKGWDRHATLTRRHSVQVCDVHRRLDSVDLESFRHMMHIPEVTESPRASSPRRTNSEGALRQENGLENGVASGSKSTKMRHSVSVNIGELNGGGVEPQDPPRQGPSLTPRQEKLFKAAIIADQNAKLAIFCTRPAIYTPVFNFLTEFMCTTALIFGALMLSERANMVYQPAKGIFDATEGIWVGFLVFVVVLSLGGPTGIAANPARDFGPRMAHFLLPIAGKGPSEFAYAWIPFFRCTVSGPLRLVHQG